MADELARRRIERQRRHIMRQGGRDLVPPPLDGSIDQVHEDLVIVRGLVAEILAETRALPVVPDKLHRAVVTLDDAVTVCLELATAQGGGVET